MKKLLACAASVALLASAGAAAARDYVWAAGSSTVFPFTTRVAENYARKTGKKAPKVESLGTGGGIKLFCSGAGAGFPDIANASRPMKKSEYDACQAKGVKEIVEIKIGFDGIVIAGDRDGADYNFRIEYLYLALAKDVLRSGKFVKNPYTTWDQIGPGMPGARISVYGPPPTSGTRDAFVELGLETGARKYPVLEEVRSNNEKKFKQLAGTIREDGAWIDAGENDNAIVGTLTKTPGALGVFGYSFLDNNRDKVKAMPIGGVRPTDQSIADGSYPLSRSLYIYVKKANVGVTPGLKEFLAEFISDAATGRGGYLSDRGLIALPKAQHDAQKQVAGALAPMRRPAA
ncbi:MAG TPA: substrate-binding domain-containing protein [Caulobacteraceae bacterium]|nr:substrate-binding domain-containing protein [Caulobacteraceae bacterium]